MTRSEWAALVAWAVLLAVVVGIVLHAWILPAQAFRPVPGVHYGDLCRNHGPYAMAGRQTVGIVLLGHVRFVEGSEPNRYGRRDCVTVGKGR